MDALTPDLAEKVLTADVRNLIKKVSDGGTLSSSARTMFHKAALLPALANDARVSSLFRKWAAGGRLNGDELIELRAWSAAPIPDSPAIEPATPSAPSFSLVADGPRFVGSRVKYPEQLTVYAALYDSDERTIKRYIARGRTVDPPDLPPLHAPAEMPAWWTKRMHTRCPSGILNAAAKVQCSRPAAAPEPALQASAPPAAANPATSLPASAANVTTADAPAVQRDFSDVQTLEFPEHVERMRRSLAILDAQLEEARRGTILEGKLVIDDGLISSRQRDYRETSAELRKAENDLTVWLEQRERLVKIDEVRAENNRISAAIFRGVCALLKTVRPQLAGKSESEQDRIWKHETLGCFASLKTAKFTTFEASA